MELVADLTVLIILHESNETGRAKVTKSQTEHSHLIIGPLWEGFALTDGSRASSSADLPRRASSLWSATFGSCRSLCFSFEEGERFAEALWWDTPGTDVRLERPGWTMSISRLEVVVA